uniref:Coiled-coil-helix-coiled-coil-helix domain-containing protein 1 n=1 Tax=Cacopsylla melanoneura TaxID=428564 RepID=A0A8D9F0Y6_9HEMI
MKLDNPCLSSMKNFTRLIKYSKSPNNVRFEAILPLELKNRVSGKGGDAKKAGCIQEMSLAFSCLKENDFVQTNCAKEIQNFIACGDKRRGDKFTRKQEFHNKTVTTGKKDLKAWEIDELLKKYPEQKKPFKA